MTQESDTMGDTDRVPLDGLKRATDNRHRFWRFDPNKLNQTQADGTTLYHITVILPDGTIEDPSRQLGMR